jgi:hypothetical protein
MVVVNELPPHLRPKRPRAVSVLGLVYILTKLPPIVASVLCTSASSTPVVGKTNSARYTDHLSTCERKMLQSDHAIVEQRTFIQSPYRSGVNEACGLDLATAALLSAFNRPNIDNTMAHYPYQSMT